MKFLIFCVVLCTDGTSNIGCGMTGIDDNHYVKLGALAKEHGTTVSIIGIEGQDCGVGTLQPAADLSGGIVNVVNPLELQRQMRMILDNPVLAVNCKVKVFLPRNFEFRHTESRKLNNVINIDVGNVTSDSDITFEFGTIFRISSEINLTLFFRS